MNELINTSLLLAGFVFTFFIPGFLVVETFFKDLPKFFKIPPYMILSLEISTYFIYLAGLIFGLNRVVVISSLIIFFVLFGIFIKKHGLPKILSKSQKLFLVLGGIVYFILFAALYRAIFFPHGNYFVMGAVNWQDTAMHTSIIESITQGNFPPVAPYYSGHNLDYYYFVDFHSAILNILYGNFFPRILVFDNPFFIFIFFVSMCALTYRLTKNKLVSIFSSVIATFYSNQMFIVFLQDVAKGAKPFELLVNNGYSLDFSGIYQVTPMIDYFLQNRPMMFGLPAFVINILLVFEGIKKRNTKIILLAGIITALSVKFQMFSFLASGISFCLASLVFFNKKRFKFILKSVLAFVTPVLIFIIFSLVIFPSQSSIVSIFKSTFKWGAWENHDTLWHIRFLLANFGVGIPVVVLGLIYLLFKRSLNKKWLIFMVLLFVVLFGVPYVMNFTIFNRDMFKFFYVGMIPLSILVGFFLAKFYKSGMLGKVVSVALSFSLIFTSILVLTWSFKSVSSGYSNYDYLAGMWIRKNTPPKSVFIGYPTVHSPATDIGGRLRVTSYINWPYSHGFNTGEDNVFTRVKDIDSFYHGNNMEYILNKYNVSYVYYGPEEISKFPEAMNILDQVSFLKISYNFGGIKIYEVKY